MAAFGALFMLLWVVMMGAMLVSWILLIVAVWRGMKAHESIALSMQLIAADMSQRNVPRAGTPA